MSGYRPTTETDPATLPGAMNTENGGESIQASQKTAPKSTIGYTQMSPALKVMCGPMLRYDTVENNTWYGAAMIVVADEGTSTQRQRSIILISLVLPPRKFLRLLDIFYVLCSICHRNGTTP